VSRPFREAVIDLAAITANVRVLRAHIGTAHTMAVVKANAYGHGAVPVARAALAGGADWLGVADIREALELRDAGITAPILAWLHDPAETFERAVIAEIAVGVSTPAQLEAVADAARAADRAASVHLKLDTGLSRNGLVEEDWLPVFARAAELAAERAIALDGIFSHLSNASPEDDERQRARFDDGLARAREAGLDSALVHLSSTAGAIARPDCRYSMVRLGIGIYGLSPWSDGDPRLALRPAMTLRGQVANVRAVAAGTGASYDLTWRAAHDTTLALVPLGYAEGIPRQASGHAEVMIAGRRHPVVGRIAMDQFIVDVGQTPVAVGDEVVVFGDPATGAPSADEWAAAAGTINYEIVTRIGSRVQRSFA
jgi:alanine racemase